MTSKISMTFNFKLIAAWIILLISNQYFIACTEEFVDYPEIYNLQPRYHSRELNFFILSDWGFSGSPGQKSVAGAMSETARLTGLDMILTTGDNFQIAGVSSVDDKLWNINFESVYADSALIVPWYPALGNHDHYGNVQAEIDYSLKNPQWNMPASYYTFIKQIPLTNQYIRFIVLDTYCLIDSVNNLSEEISPDSVTQIKWLRNILKNSTEKWIIVTGHHPVYSSAPFHGDTPEMKEHIKPVFDEYRVDLYICGHDHDFEHVRDGNLHTEYIVTGTGGSIRTAGKSEKTIFSLSSTGFTYISAHQDFLTLYFITNQGNIAYYYVKRKEFPVRR